MLTADHSLLRITLTLVALGLLLCGPAVSADPPPSGHIAGQVAVGVEPLAKVSVYAYELAGLEMTKAVTDGTGRFAFEALPAGLYKLIAFKFGFEPAIVMLSRAADDVTQFVDFALERQQLGDLRQGETYWSAREQIPPDVLREIQQSQLADIASVSFGTEPSFQGAFQAMAGLDELSGQQGQIAGGEIGMEGRIGALELGMTGQFWQLGGTAGTVTPMEGQATSVALQMQGVSRGQIDMTTIANRGQRPGAVADSSDFERYGVAWSRPIGERMSSRFAAQYLEQNNYFRQGLLAPRDVPMASRVLDVEGGYRFDVSDRNSFETGIRYRAGEDLAGPRAGLAPLRTLEVFGNGGVRVQPSVLVEYGLASRLEDGSYALAPRGTVVVQLSETWQAITTVSQRLEQGTPTTPFVPVRYGAAGTACNDLDQHCYRVLLAREGAGDDSLVVGAVHRKLADTLQLYFNDDFFHRLDQLHLVRGDELPGFQLALQRRMTPQILARLESNYAEGGGGVLYATDNNPYENRVRYLVTSINTQFQRSATGVFVAFHHLEQGLDPLDASAGADVATEPAALETMQLMLSQDLNVLMTMASDWSLHVNYQLSKGALPFSLADPESDELRHRVTGGVSVKF